MNKSIWQYSTIHNSPCKIIEEETLWGQTACKVWLPNQDAVVRVSRSALRPLNSELQPEIEANRTAYVAAAAKVAEEKKWRNELKMAKQIVLEIMPHLLMKIDKEGACDHE